MDNKQDTRDPQQERSRETKRSIVSAGLKLFSEKGFYKTNSKEIARVAGVSTGSFYAYFTDKKELFKTVLREYHQRITDELNSIEIERFIKSGGRREFIEYLIHLLLDTHEINPDFHQEIHVMSQSEPEIAAICDESQKVALSMTESMLSLWEADLRITDIEAAAVTVQRTIEEMVHTILYGGLTVDNDRLVRECTDMVYRYLFD